MSTYTSILYQTVFFTKYRNPTLSKHIRPFLFDYIGSILTNKKCHSYAVGGVEDHLHLVFSLHPTVCLSDLVKSIKISSSIWLKEHEIKNDFKAWQTGYGAFTYSKEALDNLKNYVARQEEHHRKQSFRVEYIGMLDEFGVEFEEKYLF
ncbi:MAG: putative transposase [Cryomorphaceae bacterium]|jgi:putative transposase